MQSYNLEFYLQMTIFNCTKVVNIKFSNGTLKTYLWALYVRSRKRLKRISLKGESKDTAIAEHVLDTNAGKQLS